MTVSLDLGRGPSLTVGLRFCAQFSGAFQGKRERLSVETSDEGGWKIVGDTTLITFGRPIGRSAERDVVAAATFGRDARTFGPNPMVNIDFSKAKFFGVDFRGLDLVDPDHLVLDDYPEALKRGIA